MLLNSLEAASRREEIKNTVNTSFKQYSRQAWSLQTQLSSFTKCQCLWEDMSVNLSRVLKYREHTKTNTLLKYNRRNHSEYYKEYSIEETTKQHKGWKGTTISSLPAGRFQNRKNVNILAIPKPKKLRNQAQSYSLTLLISVCYKRFESLLRIGGSK